MQPDTDQACILQSLRKAILFVLFCIFFLSFQISFQHMEFMEHCREKEWQSDMANAPQKLRNLEELNKTMAHQPWLLEPCHMEVRMTLSACILLQWIILFSHNSFIGLLDHLYRLVSSKFSRCGSQSRMLKVTSPETSEFSKYSLVILGI